MFSHLRYSEGLHFSAGGFVGAVAGPVAEAGAEAVAGVVAEALTGGVAGDDVVADDVPDSSIVYFFSESL